MIQHLHQYYAYYAPHPQTNYSPHQPPFTPNPNPKTQIIEFTHIAMVDSLTYRNKTIKYDKYKYIVT